MWSPHVLRNFKNPSDYSSTYLAFQSARNTSAANRAQISISFFHSVFHTHSSHKMAAASHLHQENSGGHLIRLPHTKDCDIICEGGGGHGGGFAGWGIGTSEGARRTNVLNCMTSFCTNMIIYLQRC